MDDLWRRSSSQACCGNLRREMKRSAQRLWVTFRPGPFASPITTGCRTGKIWAWATWWNELVVQNYAYSVNGFAKDLDAIGLSQAGAAGACRSRSASWPLRHHRATNADACSEPEGEAGGRKGMGVSTFYWEGLWGVASRRPRRCAAASRLRKACTHSAFP